MSIFNQQLDTVNIDTIKSLLGNVRESLEIEFKKQLNIGNNAEKKEFLADIVSFASSSGGDIIFGVDEKDSVAESIVPLEINDIDAKQLQLEHIIRGGISPRLNFNIYPIEFEKNKYVILIRVYKCFQGPAVVTFESPIRFYSRNSTGKYQLDYQQIKDSFISQAAFKDKFLRFKRERLDLLIFR